MIAEQMWDDYPDKTENDHYEAWAYGCQPDELARLTLTGIKTATASAYPLYLADNEDIPKTGSYSIIMNSHNEAVCIIQTTQVDVIPFNQVDEQQAYQEGEGDRSLSFWRKVHQEFFIQEMQSIGQIFDENMLVVCEKFEVVYPKS